MEQPAPSLGLSQISHLALDLLHLHFSSSTKLWAPSGPPRAPVVQAEGRRHLLLSMGLLCQPCLCDPPICLVNSGRGTLSWAPMALLSDAQVFWFLLPGGNFC